MPTLPLPAPTSWPYANSPCCTLSRRYQPCDRIAACAARLTQIDGAAALMHLLYLAKWNIYYYETERASAQTRKSQRDNGDRTRNRVKRRGRIAITVAGSAWGLLTLKGLASCRLSTPEQGSKSLWLEKDGKFCSFLSVLVRSEPPWLTPFFALQSCDCLSGFGLLSPCCVCLSGILFLQRFHGLWRCSNPNLTGG